MTAVSLPRTRAPRAARDFLVTHLLDPDRGGAHAATDPTGARPLGTERRLVDQASAVLAVAAHPGLTAELATAAAGLDALADRHGHAGFLEVTDRGWTPHGAQRLRTTRYQVHAATALLVRAHRQDDDRLRARAVDLLNRCLSTTRDGVFPTALTADWRDAAVPTPSRQATVAAIRALATADMLGESDVDIDPLPALTRELTAAARRAMAGPAPGTVLAAEALTRCGPLARVALALAHAGRLLGTSGHLGTASALLEFAATRLHDPVHGGFWDRPAITGPGYHPYRTQRTADAIDLLQACSALRATGGTDHGVSVLARTALVALADHQHGGFHSGLEHIEGAPVLLRHKSTHVHAALARVPDEEFDR